MPLWFVAFSILILLLDGAQGQRDGRAGVRYAYTTSGPMDYPVVNVQIGIPPKDYRLRLLFDTTLYRDAFPAGLPCGDPHIVLFSKQVFVYSGSMVVLEANTCGSDVVDFGGARWLAHIAYSPNNFLDEGTVIGSERRFAMADGVWILSPESCTLPNCTWSRFEASRHLFKALDEPVVDAAAATHTHGHCSVHLDTNSTYGLAHHTNVEVRIGDVGVPRPAQGGFRLAINPDAHTSYFPVELFQRYFNHHNLYRDNPERWEPIVLSVPTSSGSTCDFTIDPVTILPLSILYPGHAPLRERYMELVFHDYIWVDTVGEMTLGKAVIGYNALKVHPQALDNTTIVLAGNLLWGNLQLGIDQATHRISISPYPHRREIRLADTFFLGFLALFYLRWLLSGMWLDTTVNGKSYRAILTHIGLLSSAAFLLFKAGVGYAMYLPELWPLVMHDRQVLLIIGVSICGDVIAFLTIVLALRQSIKRAMQHHLKIVKNLLKYGLAHNPANHAPSPKHPYIPKRLYYHHGQWEQRVHEFARIPVNKRFFVWSSVHFVAWYTLLFDVVFSTAVWLVAATSDEMLIRNVLSIITFTVLLYTSIYYVVFSLEAIRPMFERGRWPPLPAVVSAMGLATAAIVIGFFTGFYIVKPIVGDYSSIYHGTALDVVILCYTMGLIFGATLMARHVFAVDIVPISQPTDSPDYYESSSSSVSSPSSSIPPLPT